MHKKTRIRAVLLCAALLCGCCDLFGAVRIIEQQACASFRANEKHPDRSAGRDAFAY
ncbi:MAG: hypothetical protein IKD72_06285 [Clostridia bacterium]|nr:hypothetical protein [Clostridia bacterium]